jgi:glycosyltransferase involved in cell wall biosynthesis
VSDAVLTLLPTTPFDPAGGAQRSMDMIARLLASRGWRSAVLATTFSDATVPLDPAELLARRGIAATREQIGSRTVYRFEQAGVSYTLLDTQNLDRAAWLRSPDSTFDALLERDLTTRRPRIVHTFGAAPAELARQAACRAAGAAVVLGVRNHGYYDPRAFAHADAVLTPSRFLSGRLRERVGVDSSPLPTPIDWAETLAPQREPVFITYVNPSLDKGVLFFARLADELASRRPDLPMLVFESRAGAGTLLAAGAAGGLDLSRHRSLMISPGVPFARDVFAAARVLLVPSCWDEPSGRVIPEAMINGVPPLVADRGGMPETVGNGGFVLPLPADYTPESRTLPTRDAVQPWIEVILKLCDDEAYYQAQSSRARAEAQLWRPEQIAEQCDAFFRTVRLRPTA